MVNDKTCHKIDLLIPILTVCAKTYAYLFSFRYLNISRLCFTVFPIDLQAAGWIVAGGIFGDPGREQIFEENFPSSMVHHNILTAKKQ